MANEGKDLRDNTRAMQELKKAILTLNDTVVMVERRRRSEENLFLLCGPCAKADCLNDAVPAIGGCKCCDVGHNGDLIR